MQKGIVLGIVSIFAGGYGSGKTEIALNYAFAAANQDNNVVLADLDLVNPYHVSRERRLDLENRGITLLAPGGELSFSDVPQLPHKLIAHLYADNHMLIDVAGDEAGGLVLGYLNRYLEQRCPFHLWLVVNPYRPFAADLEGIREMVRLVEDTSRLNFTGIISNPNLVEETDTDCIREGHRQVTAYARELALPIGSLTVREDFYKDLYPEFGSLLTSIRLYTRPEWLKD